MPGANIAILGGGIGGVVALNTLQENLSSDHEITLIDRSPVHEFKPTYLRLLTGEREYDDLVQPLDQFAGGNVTFKQAEVTEIDPDGSTVETDDGPVEYDHLIVSLGVQYDPDAIPGIERAHHVYDADSARDYRATLDDFTGGDLTVGVSSLPYICPAAPVEAALLTDHYLRKRGVREDTTMRFFFPNPQPMKKAGDNVGQAAVDALESRDIAYHGNYELSEVDDDAGELRFGNGETLPFDELMATPPHASPDVVADSPLADGSGWIPVDHETLETDYENVYAIGDCAKVLIPSIDSPLPKAGVFARKQAEVVAHHVAARVKGTESSHRFDGVGQCFLASKYGLAGEAGMIEADFFAEGGPSATINQPRMSQMWHWGKLLYEESWHKKWFPQAGGESA